MTSYTTLEVENFKGIREMKLEGLGMVNVFVGGNNVGKTSVLQAIAMAHSSFPNMNLLDGKGRKDIRYTEQEVNIHIFGDTCNLNFEYLVYRKTKDSVDLSVTLATNNSECGIRLSEPDYYLEGLELKSFKHYDSKTKMVVVHVLEQNKSEPSSLSSKKHQIKNYISTRLDDYYSFASDNFSKNIDNKSEEDVLVHLRQIEDKLEDITLSQTGFMCFSGKGKRIPLFNMGDGFIKFMGIACLLPERKNDLLLIDEIENGFHYSVQEDMWRMILTAAKDDGTQFFFTTHSYEVLESLNAMTQKIIAKWEQEKTEGYQDGKLLVGENKTSMEPVCVFSLAKNTDDVVTYKRFNKDSLNGAVALEMELRGKGAN